MTATYDPITSTVLGSSTSSVLISSIPNTYTDLRLVIFGTVSSTAPIGFRFNGDTGSVYTGTILYGNGSSASGARYIETTYMQNFASNVSSAQPFMIDLNIFDYKNTTSSKTSIMTAGNDLNGSGFTEVGIHFWRPGTFQAINSITIFPATGNLNIGTTISLYGILKE